MQLKIRQNSKKRMTNKKKANAKPRVFGKILTTLKMRKLIFFNIFNYNLKKTKKFNYKKLAHQKHSVRKLNHSMEYTIFYEPIKESLDFILSSKKLLKKNRKGLLSYFVNMHKWDRLFKKYAKKRKDFFLNLGKLPFILTRLRRRKNKALFKKTF